jgi:hypothetical protein
VWDEVHERYEGGPDRRDREERRDVRGRLAVFPHTVRFGERSYPSKYMNSTRVDMPSAARARVKGDAAMSDYRFERRRGGG